MSNRWTKNEEEILKQKFPDADWEVFLAMLPDKTEAQIFRKAKNFGLERKAEFVEEYYDDIKSAWIITFRIRGIGKVTHIFPAPKGSTLKETEDRYFEKLIKRLLKSKYITG